MNSPAAAEAPQRNVRRSFNGYLAPIAIAALGAALPMGLEIQQKQVAAARAAEKPHWVTNCNGTHTLVRPLPPPEPTPAWATMGMMGMLALFGVGAELGVRRQMELARSGVMVEAIVDDVHRRRTSRHDYLWAKWSFVTPDHKHHHGSGRINDLDATVLQMGSRVRVFYDPSNPRRNRIENGMWAVEWDEPAST